jgi:UDP-N-acetylmuramoyl-tripeptide--D-alanyl-D-alanine ligase
MLIPRDFSGAFLDSRKVRPGSLFVAIKGKNVDGRNFIPQALANGAVGVIEGEDNLRLAAKEYRSSLSATVIGVTGSVGKTTTKEFLRVFFSAIGKTHATEENYNNHIGLPLTILNAPRDSEFVILEMGMNHPGEIEFLCDIASPHVGVISSIGSAHLEYLGSRRAIAEEKAVLFSYASHLCTAPADVAFGDVLEKASRALYVPAKAEPWLRETVLKIIPGEHNVSNAAAAFEAAKSFGLTKENAIDALKNFSLPGNRWRRMEKDGIYFIDDTYNANLEAMEAALKTFAAMKTNGRKIAVLGDMFELGDESESIHAKVFALAHSLPIDLVVAVGTVSSKVGGCKISYPDTQSAKDVFAYLQNGDTVLLKASNGMQLGGIVGQGDGALPRTP